MRQLEEGYQGRIRDLEERLQEREEALERERISSREAMEQLQERVRQLEAELLEKEAKAARDAFQEAASTPPPANGRGEAGPSEDYQDELERLRAELRRAQGFEDDEGQPPR